MDIEELKHTNDLYKKNYNKWIFFKSAYSGATSLIDDLKILRNINDERYDIKYREEAAWGENLSQWIVNILSDFISTSGFSEDFSIIDNDKFFNEFKNDCDLYGTNYNVFWNDLRKVVSALGIGGILVDKGIEGDTDEIIYPYLCRYSPLAILDFKYSRKKYSNRPYLSYLKLIESDGTYKIWYENNNVWKWEHYIIIDDKAELINENINPLNKIPFTWFYNIKDIFNYSLGISDIEDIGRIDKSMISYTADMAEILQASAYPMLAVPQSLLKEQEEIETGPKAIIQFDADNPGGTKPYYLTPDVMSPIDAILKVFGEQKTCAIRISNLSAIFAAMSKDARSEESINKIMSFLEAQLNRKVDNEIEARKSVIKNWLLWQGQESYYDNIIINHSRKYDLSTLITTIKDAMTAKVTVKASKEFQKIVDKFIVNKIATDISNTDKIKIFKEIDEYNYNESLPKIE